jgi:hypothetical protein
MLGAALITIIPTLLLYLVLPKVGFKIKSNYLKLSMSWFVGMYLFTIATFLLALLLNFFVSSVLFKAALEVLTIFTIILFLYFKKDLAHLSKGILAPRSSSSLSLKAHLRVDDLGEVKSTFTSQLINILIVSGCFLFSYFFFTPQLSYEKGAIYTSPVYWDFHWHAALIQNFAYGDNFPPQNEAFAGMPHTYHYFWGVTTAIYEVMGLDLAAAINIVSIITFFFLLITIIGISQELFHSKLIGIFAVLFTLTSSSGHIFQYFSSKYHGSPIKFFTDIFTNTSHPFISAIFRINDITYNGTMYNLFYFLEERQIIFGIIYLLLCLWIIYNRRLFSYKALLIIGGFMGAYFLWHLYIAIMVFSALALVLLVDKERKKSLFLLAGFTIVFGFHYLYFKHLTDSPWFLRSIEDFPKFNTGFSDQQDKPFSLEHAAHWYTYSYGIKLLLFPISLLYLWFKNKRLTLLLSAIIIPTFIAVNTLQLSPNEIYENHKWLRPMNVLVDMTIAACIIGIFFRSVRRTLFTFPVWVILIFALTASGIIELMPYFNSKPTKFFAAYPSSVISAIDENTPPKATFIGIDSNDIQLAGRKLFLGDVLGSKLLLDKPRREKIIYEIYAAKDLHTLCSLTKTYNIDYVEFKDSDTSKFLFSLPNFSSLSQTYETAYFADVKAACAKTKI